MLKLTQEMRDFLNNKNPNLLLILEADIEELDQSGPVPEQPTPEQLNQAQPEQPTPEQIQQLQQMTPEDFLNQNINIADQKFVQFRLYDKITELQTMVDNLKNLTTLTYEELNNLNDFTDYINILNELIFTLDVNAIYQLVGQLEIDLQTFLGDINERILNHKANLDKKRKENEYKLEQEIEHNLDSDEIQN